MDIRNNKWHCQVLVSGVAKVETYHDSIMGALAAAMRDLINKTPRKLADGHKEITIRFREIPFGSSTESIQTQAFDILSDLDLSAESDGPTPDETQYEYASRLIREGTSEQAANAIAAMWFES